MKRETTALGRAHTSGAVTSLVILGGLALLANLEGKRPLQPMNATSHWLHGRKAGRVKREDLSHTLVGYLTHHVSSVFWAAVMERLLGRRRSIFAIAPRAAAVSALAAFVDYRLMPRRLTPGWETVLSARSMRAAFAVMALGLAVGALVSRNGKRSPR